MCFEEEDHRGQVPFSPHLIEYVLSNDITIVNFDPGEVDTHIFS